MNYYLSAHILSDYLQPHGLYSLPGSAVLGNSPGRNTRGGCHALLRGNLPALQAGSLPTEAPEKPSESRSAMSDSL